MDSPWTVAPEKQETPLREKWTVFGEGKAFWGKNTRETGATVHEFCKKKPGKFFWREKLDPGKFFLGSPKNDFFFKILKKKKKPEKSFYLINLHLSTQKNFVIFFKKIFGEMESNFSKREKRGWWKYEDSTPRFRFLRYKHLTTCLSLAFYLYFPWENTQK